jgi:hypothetical protein
VHPRERKSRDLDQRDQDLSRTDEASVIIKGTFIHFEVRTNERLSRVRVSDSVASFMERRGSGSFGEIDSPGLCGTAPAGAWLYAARTGRAHLADHRID